MPDRAPREWELARIETPYRHTELVDFPRNREVYTRTSHAAAARRARRRGIMPKRQASLVRTTPVPPIVTERSRRTLTIELEREDDGRWIAEVADLPGVMVYGQSKEEALVKVQALAFRVLADVIEESGLPQTREHL